jgi:hypothetical protein
MYLIVYSWTYLAGNMYLFGIFGKAGLMFNLSKRGRQKILLGF